MNGEAFPHRWQCVKPMWQGQSLPPWRNTHSLSSLRWITTGCMVLHPAVLTLLIRSDATCRDDANMKWTRLQSCRGIILTNACLLLSPSDQTMQYFTKHAIPTYTHHAGIEKKKTAPVRKAFSWWVYMRVQHLNFLPIKTSQVFLQQVVSGLVCPLSH